MYFINNMAEESFIEVARLDGSRRLVLVFFSVDAPSTLVVSPLKRFAPI